MLDKDWSRMMRDDGYAGQRLVMDDGYAGQRLLMDDEG